MSDFLAQLLAPLPADTEQADARRFMRALRDDMQAVWNEGMRRVTIAKYERQAMSLRRTVAMRDGLDLDDSETERRYFAECARQMMLPAPGKAALAWKKSIRRFNGGRPEWERRIAADEARIGGEA